MTETDKLEIANLLKGARDMTACADKMKERYVDEKVAKFAFDARNDYLNNKEYIGEIIENNPEVFFNMKDIYLGNDSRIDLNEPQSLGFAGHFRCRCKIDGEMDRSKAFGHIVANKISAVYDVWWDTSDTDLPEYKVCSARDLVDHPHEDVCKRDYEEPKTATEWKQLYGLATWTRAKNELLVRKFKDALREITAKKKEIADNYTEARDYVSKIGEYKSVVV